MAWKIVNMSFHSPELLEGQLVSVDLCVCEV